MLLKDKTILVTGSSSGIGRSIAIECAKNQAHVLIHYRKNQAGAKETLQQVQQYSQGEIYSADLSVPVQVKHLFASFSAKFPDMLVNNAGESIPGQFDDYKLWKSQWENIFMSQVYCVNEFLKNKSDVLKKIVNISSIYGLFNMGDENYPQYSAAKAAVNSWTIILARKLKNQCLVNAVAPGWVWTPPWEGTPEETQNNLTSLTQIKRFIHPDEIASLVVSLLQNDALTGEIIRVDGGLHLPSLGN